MKKSSRGLSACALAATLVIAGACDLGTPDSPPAAPKTIISHENYDPSDLSDEEIAAAAALDVYFEHASVGENVCAGIDTLIGVPTRYACAHTTGDSGALLASNWFGNNDGLGDNSRGNPGAEAKLSYFNTSLGGDLATKIDVAMFKFCWIDGPSDPNALFASTKTMMDNLESAHPAITFVWWTMPIETTFNEEFNDAERLIFNALVREHCLENGKWLLDIADLESHDDTGAAVVDASGNALLCPAYTYDGGHLDADGQLKLAKAYWKLIAEIAKTRQ